MRLHSAAGIIAAAGSFVIFSCSDNLTETPALTPVDSLSSKISLPQNSSFTQTAAFTYSPAAAQFEVYVGDGIDSNGTFIGSAFTHVSANADTSTVVTKGYTFIEDSVSLKRLLQDILNAGTKSASYSIPQHIKKSLKTDRTSLAERISIASVEVIKLHEVSFSSGKFSPAANEYTSTNKQAFTNSFGSSFISKAALGGVLIKILEAEKSGQESAADLKKAVYLKNKELEGEVLSSDEKVFMDIVLKDKIISQSFFETVPTGPISFGLYPQTYTALDSAFFEYYSKPLGLSVIGTQSASYESIKY